MIKNESKSFNNKNNSHRENKENYIFLDQIQNRLIPNIVLEPTKKFISNINANEERPTNHEIKLTTFIKVILSK